MSPYMISYLRMRQNQTATYSDTTWIVALGAIGQGGAMIFGGILERSLGPGATALIGGWLCTSGVLLTHFTLQQTAYWPVLVTYGFIFGCGAGIAYTPPMSCALRWMPDRKGLASGLIVAGYGCGAFLFSPIQTFMVNPSNTKPLFKIGADKYFDDDVVLNNVETSVLYLGCIYAMMQFVGAMLLVDPRPEKAKSTATSPRHAEQSARSEKPPAARQEPRSYRPVEMLKEPSFYAVFFTFFLILQAVTFIASFYKSFGQTFIADDKFLSLVGSVSSIFNAGGRIFWGGLIGDHYSYQVAMGCVSALLTSFVLTLTASRWLDSTVAYMVCICGIFFTFSGAFALVPVETAKLFGLKFFGINFSIMFTAYAFSAILASLLANIFYNAIGYQGIFFFAAGCTFTGFIVTVLLDVHLSRQERALARAKKAAVDGVEAEQPLMQAVGDRPSA